MSYSFLKLLLYIVLFLFYILIYCCCFCITGYELSEDFKTCKDVDECNTEQANKYHIRFNN